MRYSDEQILIALEKIANKETKDNKSTGTRVGAGVGALGLAKVSKNPATGRTRVYHGTSNDAWKKIKKEGFDPKKGGTGAAGHAKDRTGYSDFVDKSKGKVHVTRLKSVAKGFKAYTHSQGNPRLRDLHDPRKGKVIKADIPFSHYENMKADPDILDSGSKKFDKFFGSTTTEKIPVEDISGAKKSYSKKYKRIAKNLPKYIKKHPGRFGIGALGLGGAGYLADYALSSDKK